jgi:thiosulfate/3-mercaptopyruvate sulfurtransferase
MNQAAFATVDLPQGQHDQDNLLKVRPDRPWARCTGLAISAFLAKAAMATLAYAALIALLPALAQTVLAQTAVAQTAVAQTAVGQVPAVITPAELKALVEKNAVTVLDIREIFQTDGKTPNYDAGHIPGAIAAPYSEIRGPAANPGQMISESDFQELARDLGVTPDQHIVFAGTGGDATDFGSNARYYWTFKLAGFEKLSILDGGLGAWMALKYPLSTETPNTKPSTVTIKFDYSKVATDQLIAKKIQSLSPEVKSSAAAAKKPLLLDTRPEEYFLGEDKHDQARRAGTLPGAKHFDQEEFFQMNTGKLLPVKQLQSMAQSEGLLGSDDIITFCNTGHWSATAWFVLSELLGKKNVTVYPESAIGWSKTNLPMDNAQKKN